MKDISDACNIGRSTLYHYFSSVEEIYTEVIALNISDSNIDEDNIKEFLNILKYEIIKVDKSLHRAVVEYSLETRQDNCF